jgi:hypothetical protein
VIDNLANGPSDYGSFSVVVPTDDRLPLSGQTIDGFLNINPDKASLPTDNHVRLSKEYGTQYENWQGVDFNMSARLGGGTLVQGGFSTGRTAQDNCEILEKVPEGGITTQQGLSNGLLTITGGSSSLARPFCHQETPYLTQIKGLATYTIPRIDVQIAGAFQSIPGPQITATLVVPGAVVAQSLGRPLSGGGNATVNIVEAGTLYNERLHQIDLRLGKIFRFGGTRRISANIDLFNVLNSHAVLAQSNSYSSFREPSRVVGARFLKFSAGVNF